jgi:hypothetical protein
LESAADSNAVSDLTIGYLLGGAAPKNTREIICPMESPGDCQHHITDLSAQRGAAISRYFADRPFNDTLIDRLAVLGD